MKRINRQLIFIIVVAASATLGYAFEPGTGAPAAAEVPECTGLGPGDTAPDNAPCFTDLRAKVTTSDGRSAWSEPIRVYFNPTPSPTPAATPVATPTPLPSPTPKPCPLGWRKKRLC